MKMNSFVYKLKQVFFKKPMLIFPECRQFPLAIQVKPTNDYM